MENKKRILLFDLDGTLLRNDKTLSEYTLEILSKCKGQGYLIGISTSRGEQNCLGFLREMKPDILISSGGALVRVNKKIICSSSFSVIKTKDFIPAKQRAKWTCLHVHLATAARVKSPAACCGGFD